MAGEAVFRGNVSRAPTELAEWLAQYSEDPMEPDLPIIDSHIHLWNGSRGRFLAEDFHRAAEGHNVLAALFVQCFSHYRPFGPDIEQPLGETEFVVKIAEASEGSTKGPIIAPAIVAFADLNYGDSVRPVLEQHIELGKGRMRGIRHAVQYDESSIGRHGPWRPARDEMSSPQFRAGYAQLGALNLSYDVFLYHHQIPQLADLAQSFPDIPVIVNHIGMPLGVGPYQDKRDEVFAEWKASMKDLARLPNVTVKVGGMGMGLFGFGLESREVPAPSETVAAKWRPYAEHVIGAFGVERCMFESNFVIDSQSCSYGVLVNAFKRITSGFSQDEKFAFYGGTAANVYKLPSIYRIRFAK